MNNKIDDNSMRKRAVDKVAEAIAKSEEKDISAYKACGLYRIIGSEIYKETNSDSSKCW